MQFNNKLRTVAIVLAASISVGSIGFYAYTHRPLDRIPSDLENLDNITFFALGDQGNGGVKQWAVARAMEKIAEKDKDLDFVVLMGDNFYSQSMLTIDSPEWLSKFEYVYSGEYLSATPFYAVLGNHDHGKSDSAAEGEISSHNKHGYATQHPAVQIEYSIEHLGSNRCMPDWYYSADFGKVGGQPLLRVVFLDTNLKHEDLLKEADFIRQKFSGASNKPIWKIVVGHHPVRTYGKHFGETKEIEDTLMTALQEAHVDLYLSGHDHNQQVIARDGEPFYFVNGGGGAGTYNMRKQSPDLKFSRSAHGFLGVNIDNKTLKVSIYDTDGKALSTYKIDRNCTQGQANCLTPIHLPS
jgi:tartrate-resistant acid phosphatase type 5